MFTETETAVPAAADHSSALIEAARFAYETLSQVGSTDAHHASRQLAAALAAYDAEQPRVIAARVHVLATGAYAVVQGDGWTADYRLAAGKSPAASLRASADDEAERGARILRRAARMRAVADHMDRAR